MSSLNRIATLATAILLGPLAVIALAGPAAADTLITTNGAGNSRMQDAQVVLALIVECENDGTPATVAATLQQGSVIGTGTDNITCQGNSSPFLVNVLINPTTPPAAGSFHPGTAQVTAATLLSTTNVQLASLVNEGTDIDPE